MELFKANIQEWWFCKPTAAVATCYWGGMYEFFYRSLFLEYKIEGLLKFKSIFYSTLLKKGLKLFSYFFVINKLRQLNSPYLYMLIKININLGPRFPVVQRLATFCGH